MKGRIMSIFSYCLRALADLFFTRNCLVCGRGLEPGQKYVCDACLDDMPLTYFWQRSENPAMHRLGVRPGEGGACREGSACVEDVPRDARGGAAVPVASGDGAVSGGVVPRDACEGAAVPVASGVNAGCRVYNAAALFFYRHESPWCELVRRFKYGREEGLGLWASRLLGRYLYSGGLYADVQVVVPVPLHWYKRFRRGFNQAEIIARGVAEGLAGSHAGSPAGSLAGACCQAGAGGLALDEALSGMSPLEGAKSGSRADAAPSHQHPDATLPRDVGGNGINVTTIGTSASTYTPADTHTPAGTRTPSSTHTAAPAGPSAGRNALPVAAHLLRRRRYTGTQTRKTAAERRGNIAGAFALNPRALSRLKAAGVSHVLLVDDVLTTGATLSECIRLLSPHFRVSVATLGFVE